VDQVVSLDWKAVRRYLRGRRDLGEVVPALCEHVRAEFGPEAELALEVYSDPEVRDEYLTLYVRLASYPPDMLERLERAGQPFEARLTRATGYVLVTTDFRTPSNTRAV
jgi:hypothetical protein